MSACVFRALNECFLNLVLENLVLKLVWVDGWVCVCFIIILLNLPLIIVAVSIVVDKMFFAIKTLV